MMAHCAFDEDAETITPLEARATLRAAGFEILRTDFAFVFPRILSILRPLERLARHLPIGAQYQVLCQNRWGSNSDAGGTTGVRTYLQVFFGGG